MRAASARGTSERCSRLSSASRRSAEIFSSTFELLDAPARQASTLDEAGHRPWPLPEGPWVMGQTWDDLLFAHYRVEADLLRGLVSDNVEVEEHSGSAWLGVTPFAVIGLRARGLPALPFVSSFLELNVRTYVSRDGKPGIWFFSLDASSRLAVEAARRFYRLPYHQATINLARQGETITYECSRHSGKAFSGSYRPEGDAFQADEGTLEHFLTERYCLYTEDRGSLYRAEIHHRPWQLRPAGAQIELNTMPPSQVHLNDEPLLHYSARQDVVIWPPEGVP